MPFNLESQGAQKDQFVVGLAALLLKDVNAEINAESIQAVVDASKNTVPAYYPTLFASFIEKAGGLDKYTAGPSAGAGKTNFYFILFKFEEIEEKEITKLNNKLEANVFS